MPTSYRGNIKTLLMRGKIFRQQGSKLAGKHSRKHLNTITHSGSGFTHPMSGTISHRPLNPDLNGDFERFRISSGQGISQNAVNGSILASLARIKNATKKKSSAKKSSAKKKGNFKSLKFNF
jgi:hypothetical protein